MTHLLDQLRSASDPRAAAVGDELVRCLVQLYGACLARIVQVVGAEQARDLCADPLVESLMLVHDLHPLDTDTRIRRALDRVRPHLGELHYEGIDDGGVAHVRRSGAGHGCRSSVRKAIESAVVEAAPEVTGVAVDMDVAPPPLLSISRGPGLGAAR